MIKQLLAVQTFMQQMQQETPDLPVSEITEADFELRRQLMYEELSELLHAMSSDVNEDDNETKPVYKVDQAQALDGLCDLLYVVFGTANTLGLQQLLPIAFAKVHQSNMSKLWTRKEVSKLMKKHRDNNTQTTEVMTYLDTKDERKCRDNNQYGKVLKSPS